MVTSCVAYNCENRHKPNSGISYFSFPFKNKNLLKKWINAISRAKWKPKKHSRICSQHFKDSCFQYLSEEKKILKPDAIPTIFNRNKIVPKVSSKRRNCEEMPKLYNQILIDVLFKNSGPNTSKIADTPAAENDLIPNILEQEIDHSTTANKETSNILEQEITHLTTADKETPNILEQEINHSTTADKETPNILEQEINHSTTADKETPNILEKEINHSTTADKETSNILEQEIYHSTTANKEMSNILEQEINHSTTADKETPNILEQEISHSTTADKGMSNILEQEINHSTTADKETQTSHSKEQEPTYDELKNQINNYKHLVEENEKSKKQVRKNIDKLKRTIRYHKTKLKNEKMQKRDILKKLQQFQKNNKTFEEVCDSKFDPIFSKVLKSHVKSSKKNTNIDIDIKRFAFRMHFYSGKGYEFLRNKIPTLPHPSSLSRWSSNINTKPGMFEDSFIFLEKLCIEKNETLLCSLMFDEMAIKAASEYQQGAFHGGINDGFNIEETNKGAKEALFFMAVPLKDCIKIPLGYALIDGINALEKSNLIKKYLAKLIDIGIRVVSVTFDGTQTNLSAMHKLGVDYQIGKGSKFNLENLRTFFYFGDQKIYTILDVAHLIKLIRNWLHKLKKIVNGLTQQVIKWDHLVNLLKKQEKEGLHAANKLKSKHIHFENIKMNVKVAAQTLSSSVATSLEFCLASKYEDFLDESSIMATVEFIRLFDSIFDILNTRSPLGKYYKSAINPNNNMWRAMFQKAYEYILNLRDDSGRLLCDSSCKTGFVGFIISMKSVEMLSEELVLSENPPLRFLLTHKLSQDHLENFFSVIRSRLGSNNNPTALELQRVLRRILVGRVDASLAKGTNCESDNTTLPQVSSQNVTDCNDLIELNHYCENITCYIAGYVVKKIQQSYKCKTCIAYIAYQENKCNKPVNDEFIILKSKGGLTTPARDVEAICSMTEKILRGITGGKPKFNVDIKNLVLVKTLNALPINLLFRNLENHVNNRASCDLENHIYDLVKEIITTYTDIRSRKIGKDYDQSTNERQKLTKLILFKHQ